MYDLDAVANEAEGIPFDFMFDGEKYQLPGQVDVVAAAALAAGDFYGCLARLLGTEQFERLAASEKVFSQAKFTALLAEYKRHTGAGLGESAASTDS